MLSEPRTARIRPVARQKKTRPARVLALRGGPLHSALRLIRVVLILLRWGSVPLWRSMFLQRQDTADLGRRLRSILEQLGATFTKLGQFLATRFDILPAAIYREMQELYDSAPRIPLHEVRRVIATEFGRDPDELFDPLYGLEYVASASIAQVHRARTFDGEIVAVKVMRSGIEATLNADFRLLRMVAAIGDGFRFFGEISLRDLVRTFIRATLREVDFELEAQASERVAQSANPGIQIPRVRWDLTGPRVLTMEFIEGSSIQSIIKHLDAGNTIESLLPGVSLQRVVDTLADESLSQLYLRGFFHGDPHPANYIICPDGAVALIDFGIFGELSDHERHCLGRFFECLALGDIETSSRFFMSVSPPTPWTDVTRYRRELMHELSEWHEVTRFKGAPVASLHPAPYMGRIANIMRKNAVIMEPNLVLFWRCILTMQALALRLPVAFDLIGKFREFFAKNRTMESIGLSQLLSADQALRWAGLLSMVPRRAEQIVGRPVLHIRTESATARLRSQRRDILTIMLALMLIVGALILSDR